jgi:hypothetical protein
MRFDQCDIRGRNFNSSNRFQGHHQRWEEVHSSPNGQSYHREEAQGAPSADGTRELRVEGRSTNLSITLSRGAGKSSLI